MSHAEATALLTRALSTPDHPHHQHRASSSASSSASSVAASPDSDSPPAKALFDQLTEMLSTNSHLTLGVWPVVLALIVEPRSTTSYEWAIEMIKISIAQSKLSNDTIINLSLPALNAIKFMLGPASKPSIQKIGLQAFATMYPLLFKYACSSVDQQSWTTVNAIKTSVLELWRNASTGIKIAAVKVLQRIIQTQTKGATADPRRRTATANIEPNLNLIKPNHAFLRASVLEGEANKLLEELITFLFTSTETDTIQAIFSTLIVLVKSRPAFAQLIITASSHWTPDALVGKPGVSPTQIRSTEKLIRTGLTHLLKSNSIPSFATQVTEFLNRQALRMDAAASEARQQRQRQRKQQQENLRKRQLVESTPSASTSTLPETDPASKRRRIDPLSTSFDPSLLIPGPIDRHLDLRSIFLAPSTIPNPLAQFDSSILPLEVCLNFLIASLQDVDPEKLNQAIEATRRKIPGAAMMTITQEEEERPAIDPLKMDLGEDDEQILQTIQQRQDEEDQDEEIDLQQLDRNGPDEPEKAAEEEEDEDEDQGGLPIVLFEPPLLPISTTPAEAEDPTIRQARRLEFLKSTVRRICRTGGGGGGGSEGASGSLGGNTTTDSIWSPLVTRLITRGLDRLNPDERADDESGEPGQDEDEEATLEAMRRELFDFVTQDLGTRIDFARLWLNEEWYAGEILRKTTERRRSKRNGEEQVGAKKEEGDDAEDPLKETPYHRWSRQLLEYIMSKSTNRDRSFTQFVLDLPELPLEEMDQLGAMCLRRDQVQLGFSALRELALLRPPARKAAVDVLLGLTTHKDRLTRNAAINTVKKWVPDHSTLSNMVTSFAISLYTRMETSPKKEEEERVELEGGKKEEQDSAGADEEEVDMAMEVSPEPEAPKPNFALVKNAQVVDHLDPPEKREDVIRHVELLFALCNKYPVLLEPLFEKYANLQPFAQEQILSLINPLIKSLGIENTELLRVIDLAPEGADTLLLRVLNLLGEKLPRLPSVIIQSVKKLAKKRVLDPQFYVMIVSECDKDELKAYIPRMVTLLDGTPERKSLIRSVFLAAVAPPSEKGSMAARARINLLTPVELITALHQSDSISGIKPAIEAISICFSMTDAFRPEILTSFMQTILDQSPTIPTLFMRTVIQAVTTYKSTLASYVSSTLLIKLIHKQIWSVPPVWEGFIRLAKLVQPGSFKAVLMLPKEQLQDFVNRQPGLIEGLRKVAKNGLNGEAAQNALEVLGEEEQIAVESAPTEEVQESTQQVATIEQEETS